MNRNNSFILALFLLILVLSGCQAMNEDPNNKRVWFPSLVKPGHLNPNHEYYTPNGSDPYMNTTVGPRALDARPQGYDMPRAWERQVAENQAAVVELKENKSK